MAPRLFIRTLVLVAVLLTVAQAEAQSYAPETRFHDIAQRHYVVELARVLAWKENQAQPKIAEITYALASEADGAAKWDIKWLDAKGGMARQFTISYPAAQLVTGPAWHREVYQQMAAGMKATPLLTGQQLVQEYWKGADLAGYSRTAGLRAAFGVVPTKPAKVSFAPQLSALLAHSALSSLSDRVTLDSVLLARSAAWLAVAESTLQDREATKANLDALWSPILFLAGRENAAGELWSKAGTVKPNAMAAGWDFLLKQPATKDAFVFVTKAENRRFMLPMMNYHCRRLEMSFDFENVLPQIFGEERMLTLLYDHLPVAVRHGSVSTGHPLSNAAPLARQDWLDCLRKFEPTPQDYTGYQPILKKMPTSLGTAVPDAPGETQDFSLMGFDTLSPLLALGEKEGVGPLTPVATLSARDLLNYGWETTGLQMGARYQFVARKWGVPELAKAIQETVCAKLPNLGIFMLKEPKQGSPTVMAAIDRLQEVQYLFSSVDDYQPLWKQAVATFEDFTSRYWLDPSHVRSSCSAFYHANKTPRILPYIERLRAEGGPLCDGYLRQWFAEDLMDDGLRRVPRGAAYKAKLIGEQRQKEFDRLTFNMVWPDYARLPAFERAQAIEKAYWEGAAPHTYEVVFDSYVEAHAYQAAKRFYEQVESRIEPVTFSNTLGPRRFTLAYLEGDRGAMEEAVQASATASYEDMVLNINAAAAADNFKAIEQQIDECLERYGKSAPMSFLKGFMPLLPALRNPAHADHQKALDYFAKDAGWITFQWIASTQAKLSVEEKIRFFGGPETDWARQFVILAVRKDKAAFQAKYDDHEKNWQKTRQPWKATVLMHHLRNEVLEIPTPPTQPDLKPADAMTLSERVLSAAGVKGQ